MVPSPLSRTFAFVALAFTGATLLAFGQRHQETPVVPAPPTTESRVEALEKLVAEQQAELARLGRLSAGLAAGIAKLATAGEVARAQGFEAAGPNPAARTALLAGITELAAEVKQAIAPPAAPEAAPRKQ